MALNFNGTEIKQIYFNGVEMLSLQYNGTGYFGKGFSLTKNVSSGVTFTVKRISSPNQHGVIGTIVPGNEIYYGDVITITCVANSGYTNPKLYVDIGSGMAVRTSPYTFTVTGNVAYYGTATMTDWQTVWSGMQVCSTTGSFAVPGLPSDGQIQVTVSGTFREQYKDGYTGNITVGNQYHGALNRSTLPATIYGSNASVYFYRNGSSIGFQANRTETSAKGYTIIEIPTSIVFTEVRWKA